MRELLCTTVYARSSAACLDYLVTPEQLIRPTTLAYCKGHNFSTSFTKNHLSEILVSS